MQESLEAIRSGVDGAVEGLRDLVFDLRPVILDHAGLEPALRQYAGTLDGGLSAAVESRLKRDVPSEAAIILYRIAQEALANVRKHAKASRVTILLDEREGGFLVQVQDNGIGFSPPTGLHSVPGHLGLSSMRERAEMAGGWCTVRSLPRGGTAVEAWVPATVGAAPAAQPPSRYQSMLVQNGGNGSQLADAKAS
jgi:signal transduction histidine kinase